MPRVVHFELPATDPDVLVRFYETVFGWQFYKWDGPADYWLIQTGPDSEQGINGGMGRRQEGMSAITNTIQVSSVDDYAAKVQSAGGQIVLPKMPIPGVGYLAYFKDPDGNVFGIMENDEAAA